MCVKRKDNSRFIDRKGEIHFNKQGYAIEIVEFYSTRNCTIEFENGVVFKNMQYGNVKLGNIKNPYHPSTHGVGYIGVGNFIPSMSNKDTPHYIKWCTLLTRCYHKKSVDRRLTYKDCRVCEKWHNFQNFAKWFEENYIEGFELDKDILVKGNKIYSPETCCFVPHEINNLFTKSNSARGKYPIGVTEVPNNTVFFRYRCAVSIEGAKSSKSFPTPEQAFQEYKTKKEQHIRKIANKWKDQITEQTYNAMYNYNVEVTD